MPPHCLGKAVEKVYIGLQYGVAQRSRVVVKSSLEETELDQFGFLNCADQEFICEQQDFIKL